MNSMDLLTRAVEIYEDEGYLSLLSKIPRYTHRTVSPVPAVTNTDTPSSTFVLKPLYNWYFNLSYGVGTEVISEDWDTLILLDACRYDDFRDVNQLPGELNSRISRGVDSPKFIRRNFFNRQIHDAVYVTANPHVSLLNGDEFYKTITDPIDQWDANLGCVRPRNVTQAAKKAHEVYTDKRIIVHYMQPHDPPLGPTAEQLREEYEICGPVPGKEAPDGDRIMKLVANGTIATDRARTAYKESIKIVLEEVRTLLNNVSGKVVISADHGEHFGEQPYPLLGELYEHYDNPRTVELCKVPWFVIDTDTTRPEIEEEKPANSDKLIPEKTVKEQLHALGYK
jgi:hypothetical protein